MQHKTIYIFKGKKQYVKIENQNHSRIIMTIQNRHWWYNNIKHSNTMQYSNTI